MLVTLVLTVVPSGKTLFQVLHQHGDIGKMSIQIIDDGFADALFNVRWQSVESGNIVFWQTVPEFGEENILLLHQLQHQMNMVIQYSKSGYFNKKDL